MGAMWRVELPNGACIEQKNHVLGLVQRWTHRFQRDLENQQKCPSIGPKFFNLASNRYESAHGVDKYWSAHLVYYLYMYGTYSQAGG